MARAYFLLGLSILTVGTIPVALIFKDRPPTIATDVVPSAVAAIVGISYVGVLTHLIPMLTDRAMSAAAAARLVSLLGVSAIAGHLLIGVCLDRFPAARVAALTLALSGLAVGVIAVAQSKTVLALATMLLGAALGADTDLLPYLVSRYFSLKSYGEFLGYCFAAGTLGAAAGAFFMGRVFDVYHSYIVMTSVIAATSIVIAALVCLLPKTTDTAAPDGS